MPQHYHSLDIAKCGKRLVNDWFTIFGKKRFVRCTKLLDESVFDLYVALHNT